MDKIKISISKYTYDILLKDMDAFLMYKVNGELNKNEFLNKLIVNYYDEYSLESKEQESIINRLISKYITNIDPLDKISLSSEIASSIKDNLFFSNSDEGSIIINLKPTKASIPIIDLIINKNINNKSISSYFREMFDSYVNLTQNLRERIIFKSTYENLILSLAKSKKVFITFRNEKSWPITASLYCLKDNKEEMFNYCLFDVSGTPMTIRLAKIASIKLLNEQAYIKEDLIPLFEFQINNNIAYPIEQKDFDIVKVKLSETGLKLYKRIYLYRPNYYNIEGDIYYFRGSHAQIESYFRRFGRHAIILEPYYLKEKMKKFYKDGLRAYND